MTRPPGRRNADFEQTRGQILDRIAKKVLTFEATTSLRSLAAAGEVSIPTLRHYFGDREGVLEALYEDRRQGGEAELETTSKALEDFSESIHSLLTHIADGFRYGGLTELNSFGLVEGLANKRLADSYLSQVLEPTLAAIQSRLDAHVKKGQMKPCSTRFAAISLISPLFVAFLHQDGLRGKDSYPMEVEALLNEVAGNFVAVYKAKP